MPSRYSKPILEVITPALTKDLVSLLQLKTALGITTTTDDVNLVNMIHAASADIAGYCNRVFVQEEVVETFKSHNPNTLLELARTPIVEIAAITINDSLTPLDSDLYEFDPNADLVGKIWALDSDGRRVFYPESWSSWFAFCSSDQIVVEYTGGYALDNIPYELQQACIEQVRVRRLSASQGLSTLTRVEVPGVWSKSYSSTITGTSLLSDGVKDMIHRFRRVPLPR